MRSRDWSDVCSSDLAKAPVTVAGSAVGMAGSAVGLAKDAASAGLAAGGHVLKAVTSTALGAVAPKAQDDTQPNPTDVEPETPTSRAPSAGQPSESKDKSAQSDQTQSDQAESGSTDADALEIDPDEPVNVTEELGLDPSPIAKPKRKKAPAKKPATKIDAAADTSQVTATPADVAKVEIGRAHV